MRYDRLLNYKKWPSDSSKGSGTLTFWPSHSVKFVYFPRLDLAPVIVILLPVPAQPLRVPVSGQQGGGESI